MGYSEMWSLPVLGIAITIIYSTAMVLYRLYLSPIANIPGPKLAAATGWYETYYDVFCGGQFTLQLEKWHQSYGPIIRINPWEVHISDVDFYETLYSSKSKYSKLDIWRYRFGLENSTFDTVEHGHHHMRRKPLNNFFSLQKIRDFSPYIQSRSDRLAERLNNEYKNTGKVACLNDAFAALVADTITYYAFAMSYDFIEYPNFVSPFTTAIRKLAKSLHVMGHFPFVLRTLQSLPESVVGALNADMKSVFTFHAEMANQIKRIITGENTGNKEVSHKTVFHEILNADLPPQELMYERLRHEGASIVGGGIDTTKTALAVTCYHILANPQVHQTLVEELEVSIPNASNMPHLVELEQLPYLSAVIREGLRLSLGVVQRLARTNPYGPVEYKGFTIPANYRFGMTSYLQLRDPSAFPSPDTFDPERWLQATPPADRHFVPFSRGPRMCVGMNLARAEIYIALATLFRKVPGLKLFETGRDAVDMAAEYVAPMPSEGTKGVRVIVQ